jgi:site-specific DNA-cytosine methylase
VSLFSGAGGFDIGGAENGFVTGYACDLAENSEKFYKNNFPDVPFDLNDVRNVTLERINKVRKTRFLPALVRGEIDVLSGGSPCVKLAACNTVDARHFAPENMLMFETMPKIVLDLQPKIAVFENSDRLCSKGNEPVLMEYIASIKNLLPNYWYKIKVINAKRHGAFQSRSRSIVILVRKDVLKDIAIPLFPRRQRIDLSKQGVEFLLSHVVAFSAGQFKAEFKSAEGRLFCTLTASTCQLVKEADNRERKISLSECRVITGMTEYDFRGICDTGQYSLLGNMVMRQLTEALFKNFLNIL